MGGGSAATAGEGGTTGVGGTIGACGARGAAKTGAGGGWEHRRPADDRDGRLVDGLADVGW
jgi:hypothetical protein